MTYNTAVPNGYPIQSLPRAHIRLLRDIPLPKANYPDLLGNDVKCQSPGKRHTSSGILQPRASTRRCSKREFREPIFGGDLNSIAPVVYLL